MRKDLCLLLSSGLVLACASAAVAQGRPDTTEMRARQAARQRAIEDPKNNPFKNEPYDPLKPYKPPPSPLRATVELKVVGVFDGDTLIITNAADQQLLIRLQGIDAPEEGQASKLEAQGNLANLANGKVVTVEFDPRGKPDDEGRITAKVFLDGEDIGLKQIRAGFAWYAKTYKKMQSESDRYTYPQAEKDARSLGLGLWREKHPKAPWKYRKQ